MTIAEINAQYQFGKTAEIVIQETLDKLKQGNPRLNAATEIMEYEALEQVKHAVDGPLKGIPFSIKECYALAGKSITSASKRMAPIACAEDAVVVQKLKQAGAIPMARGNTSEFLMGRETDNLLYGTTNNPINPKLTAGGSSGGDGSMVGAGLVAFGIGTDIGGSCRYPAVFNGIVGFKPASGQIDKTGIFPGVDHFAETMNSPGILCSNVSDVRAVYNVIGNKTLTFDKDISQTKIYTCETFKVKVKDPSIKAAMKHAVAFLKSKSFEKVSDMKIPESGSLHNDYMAIMADGFIDKIYDWASSSSYGKLSILGELINRIKGQPTLSKELFSLLPGWKLIAPSKMKAAKAMERVKGLRNHYEQLLDRNGILVLPTVGILAPRHGKFIPLYNKPGVIQIITPVAFCNVLNLSCITVPARKYQKSPDTNPPGIQLVCRQGSEELLLNTAEALMKELS